MTLAPNAGVPAYLPKRRAQDAAGSDLRNYRAAWRHSPTGKVHFAPGDQDHGEVLARAGEVDPDIEKNVMNGTLQPGFHDPVSNRFHTIRQFKKKTGIESSEALSDHIRSSGGRTRGPIPKSPMMTTSSRSRSGEQERSYEFGGDHLAQDDSVRTTDEDGHLRVAEANISKACVNPYVGREIPGWQALGLDAEKVYRLYRDPRELRKAASTFVGKPILIVHDPLSADDHPFSEVVGAVGTDVRFVAPYLRAPLSFWPREAIDAIESDRQKELSAGYRYDPDMRPGKTPAGESYDGVMRNIRGNHVALVKQGRAGPDVVVGDSIGLIKEHVRMATATLSRKARVARAAVAGYLAPILAADAQVELTPLFAKITNRNYEASIPALVRGIEAAVDGQLAQDATPEGLHVLLEALSKVDAKEPNLGPQEQGDPVPGLERDHRQDDTSLEEDAFPGGEGEEDMGMEEVTPQTIKAYLEECLSPEQFAAVTKMLAALKDGGEEEEPPMEEGGGEEEPPMEEGGGEDPEDMNGDEPPPFRGRPRVGGGGPREGARDRMRTGAMDAAAVQRIVDAARTSERRAQRDLSEAERFVRPFVGDVVGCDSAEEVYVRALKIKGVPEKSLRDIPAHGLRLLLEAHQPPRRGQAQDESAFAQDSERAADYATRFPGADRIQHA